MSYFNPGQTWSKPNKLHLLIGFDTFFIFSKHSWRPIKQEMYDVIKQGRTAADALSWMRIILNVLSFTDSTEGVHFPAFTRKVDHCFSTVFH